MPEQPTKPYRLVLATPVHTILSEFDREHEAVKLAQETKWRGPVEVQERHEVYGEGECWKLKGRKELNGEYIDFVHGETDA